MTSRRRFLHAAAAGPLAASAYAAKRDVRNLNLTKEDLGTPAMILDLDIFEKNLATMAAHSKSTGLKIRPHVKIHKCPEISKRQVALGAIGASVATIAEAELISGAGVRGVLWTCQPAGKNKISRAAALARKDSTFLCVVDDPLSVDLLDEAAAAAGTKINTLVDVYVGLTRQGVQPGEPALQLARKVSSSKNLRLAGLMGYSGDASHTKGWENRRKKSLGDLAALVETREMCRKSGLNTAILSGGSTGTYNIDHDTLTELQCGSYIFMDTAYTRIGAKSGDETYSDFGAALTVMTTVVSKTRPRVCSIDAGNKALLRTTDEVKDRPGVKIQNQGAEYGLLLWNEGDRDFKLGDRVEIYPTNLDMSTNVYDRYYVARGERIVDAWPIMGRAGAAQR
ncbi:MAG: alanine racemase [Bryobacteraceae bacterium]